MKKLIQKLKEPSTWQGIIVVLALAGVELAPEQTDSIIQAGIALAGAILIFKNEK